MNYQKIKHMSLKAPEQTALHHRGKTGGLSSVSKAKEPTDGEFEKCRLAARKFVSSPNRMSRDALSG